MARPASPQAAASTQAPRQAAAPKQRLRRSAQGPQEIAQRLDTLLHRLRFAKTRGRAQALIAGGLVRIDGERCAKPDAKVQAGQVLTLPLPAGVRVVRILILPARRGPAPEARACYEEVSSNRQR